MTLFLLFAWGAGGFISYSMALILPSILERHQDMSHDIQYLFIVIVSSFEIFAFVLSKIMMDNPSLGRKKSIWISAVIVLSVSVLIIIFGENSEVFILLIFIAMKVFSLTWFNVIYLLSRSLIHILQKSMKPKSEVEQWEYYQYLPDFQQLSWEP